MFNILDTIIEGLSALNTTIGIGGSLITIFDNFKNTNHIEEKSKYQNNSKYDLTN